MTFVNLDDNLPRHPKMLIALEKGGDAAGWLYVAGLAYCNEHLTDGFVPALAAKRMLVSSKPDVVIEALVTARLWERADGGFMVHDYFAWNASRAEVEKRRADSRVRKARSRSGAVAPPDPPPSRTLSQRDRQRDSHRDGPSDTPRDGQRDDSGSHAHVTPAVRVPRARAPTPSPTPAPPPETPPSPPVGGMGPAEGTAGVAEPRPKPTLVPDPPPADDAPAGAEVPETHRRYTDAYAEGLRRGLGGDWTFPVFRGEWLAIGTLLKLAVVDGKPLRGEPLLAWVRDQAAAYGKATAGEARFQSGFAPTACLRWMNAQKPAGRPEPRSTVAVQPGVEGHSWSRNNPRLAHLLTAGEKAS